MFRKITLVAAVLAVALSVQAVFAGENRPDRPDRRDKSGDEDRRPMGPGRGFGRGPGRGWGMGPGMMGHGMAPGMLGFGHRFMDELELTDAQKTQMVDLLTARFREGLLARMEMADAARKLHELTDSETPDKDAIIAANQALGAARGKLEALALTARQEMRKLLTPEQIAKLDEIRGRRFGDRDADDDNDGPRGWGRRMQRRGMGMRGPGFRGGCCD